MPERRSESRPGDTDRRGFPRPPLWLNLLLLGLGVAGLLGGWAHHATLESRYTRVLSARQSAPLELRRLGEELAEADLTEEALAGEVDARAEYLRTMKLQQFYIAVDTEAKRLRLQFGNDVVREAPLTIGAPAVVRGKDGRTWTFTPLKGAWTVAGKQKDMAWTIPEWVYLARGIPVPAARPRVPGGLGSYVVALPNGYVIHSPPAAESPLTGAKPGSFMVPEEDLAAIWPRIDQSTRVYVF